jgi:HlyD family secretion protein
MNDGCRSKTFAINVLHLKRLVECLILHNCLPSYYFNNDVMINKNLSFALLLFLLACQKKVEKIQPKLEAISESVYASGVIKSQQQYQAFGMANGLIQQVLVKEGDIIKVGDPLFVIQNEASRLNVENAKLAVDFAQINVEGDKLNELKVAIEMAKNKMLNDSIALERQKSLWAQQIGSKLQLEQAELSYTISLNNYRSALFRFDDLRRQLKFAAAQSKKQYEISNSIRKDYVVKSQINGRVYAINKAVGEIVNTQTPLAIIGDANHFLIELQIDEKDIVRVKTGQQLFLAMDSYKGKAFEGKITKINPIMNERTRTFLVEGIFIERPEQLYPNLTCEANIVIHRKEKAITIPRAYLSKDSFVIGENKQAIAVKTGLKDFQKVEILSGLNVSDFIIKPK